MRIGLFADLHANREAFEACLGDARRRGIDRSVFLGDLVGYGADPGWVLDAVMEEHARGAVVLLGNHDQAVLVPPDRSMHEDAQAVVSWTRGRLTPGQTAFLGGLPLACEEEDRLYVHANAWKPAGWEYVATVGDARRSLEATAQRITFCGHLHEPALFHQGVNSWALPFTPVAGVGIPLGSRRRWLAVLGAVGQPRDGNPAAAYAILDAGRAELTYLRVPYDTEAAAAKIRAAGLPPWLADRLAAGR